VHLGGAGTHESEQPVERVIAASGVVERIPSNPPVCDSSWRTLTVSLAAASITPNSGRYRRTGASRSTRPSSMSCMTKRRRPHLGDRADLEHAVGCRFHARVPVDDARSRLGHVVADTYRDAAPGTS
jgi:hypothetical protein